MAKRKSKKKAKGYLLPKYQDGTSVFPQTTDKYGNTGTKVKHAADIDQETGEAYAFYKPLYSLPEVTVSDKLDRTNPTAVKNWSEKHDPIAHAVRKKTDEAAENINSVAEFLPGYGEVRDLAHLGNSIYTGDNVGTGIGLAALAIPGISPSVLKKFRSRFPRNKTDAELTDLIEREVERDFGHHDDPYRAWSDNTKSTFELEELDGEQLIGETWEVAEDSNLDQVAADVWETGRRAELEKQGNILNKSGIKQTELESLIEPKHLPRAKSMQNFENTLLHPDGKLIRPPSNKIIETSPIKMSDRHYVEEFNRNTDYLNDIIKSNNKSGIDYNIENLGYYDNLITNSNIGGQHVGVNLKPGQWKGSVMDIPSLNYQNSIPGMQLTDISDGVFGDGVARRGTGLYKSINQYLKEFDLGRLSSGRSGQTDSSLGLWKNAVKNKNASGFYETPGAVSGIMYQNGGSISKYQNKGRVQLKEPLLIADLNEFNKRKVAYDDSTKAYTRSAEEFKRLGDVFGSDPSFGIGASSRPHLIKSFEDLGKYSIKDPRDPLTTPGEVDMSGSSMGPWVDIHDKNTIPSARNFGVPASHYDSSITTEIYPSIVADAGRSMLMEFYPRPTQPVKYNPTTQAKPVGNYDNPDIRPTMAKASGNYNNPDRRPGYNIKMPDGSIWTKEKYIKRYGQANWDKVNKERERAEDKYQNGGRIRKYQNDGRVKGNVNDWLINKQEIQDYHQEYYRMASKCQSGKCLERAAMYYDQNVAGLLGTPRYNTIKETAGVSSSDPATKDYAGPHARYEEYGHSPDSWDIHGLLQEKGAKQIYAYPLKQKDGNNLGTLEYTKVNNKFKKKPLEEREQFYRDMKMPIGSLVGLGMKGGSGAHYGTKSYNKQKGLVSNNHSAVVVGYDETGLPYIYDWSKVRPITETYLGMMVTNITAPKEVGRFTYDYLQNTGELADTYRPLKLKVSDKETNSEYDVDEFDPFIKALEDNKLEISNSLGIDFNMYDELAKRAVATAIAETKGGDDTVWRPAEQLWGMHVPAYTADKLGFGKTTGITQINEDLIWARVGTEEQRKGNRMPGKLNALGIEEETYDPWDPEQQARATIAFLYDNLEVGRKNLKSGVNEQTRTRNKLDLPDEEVGYYQWFQPSLMYKGEAWGESEKVKNFRKAYAKVSLGYSDQSTEETPTELSPPASDSRQYGGSVEQDPLYTSLLNTFQNGGEVEQRRGVRENHDGNSVWTPSGQFSKPSSESSHLMRAEYIPERGWVGFPSLFQDSKPYEDDSENWVDMSEEKDWMKVYEEAEKRGEVYDFGEDKEAALAFGKGSWKDSKVEMQNGGEVLPEELPHQEIVSFPTEREPAGDPRVPKSASVQDYYTNLENTPIPKTISKKYKIWEDAYKSPMGLPIKSYKNIYDIQAFFNSGDWKESFENIENYRKSSHPMIGSVDPKTNTFIPSEENLNTNEEIASHIDINAIPVNFKKVERIPINPDGFAPGSATEFADKVIIPSSNITMKDMKEPILANGEMLMPGDEAQFDTDYVVEEKLPKAQYGIDTGEQKKQYPYESCVTGMCNDLSRQNSKGTKEFRQLNNLYGNAWNLLDTSYGEDIDISEGYENLKEGDMISLSRKAFDSDIEKKIPASEQHMGRITMKDGNPYVRHYIGNRGTNPEGKSYGHYYEEPIDNISEVFNYKVSRAKRPLAYKDIKYGENNFRFDDNYTPNSVEKDAASVHENKNEMQDLLKLNTDEYDELAKVAYGIMGNESSFGRSKRSVYRMAVPDPVQKIVKVLDDEWEGRDNYDSNINNLSQGYSSTKESTLHGVQSSNPDETWKEVNDRIKSRLGFSGDYSGLDKSNNYLYETFKELGLNSKNLENGANSMKAIMATLNWYKKRYPNITTDGLLKMYTGKRDLKEYKKRFNQNLKNINKDSSDNTEYTWLEKLYGNISNMANISYEALDDIKSFVGSKVRDNSPFPATLNAILADMAGVKGDITEKSLSFITKNELEKIVERQVKDGKMYLDYNSYFPELSRQDRLAVSGAGTSATKTDKITRLLSPEGLLQNFLGQATIVDLGNGEYEVQDTYDFNDEGTSFGVMDDLEKRGPHPYNLFRSLGRNYGSSDGQGAKVRIKVKLDKKVTPDKRKKKITPNFGNFSKLQYGGKLKAQDGLTVDNTKTSMPIDPKFLEGAVQGAVQEAVAKEEFEKLPKKVQEKIVLQQQINDPEFRNKNKGELHKGLTTKEKVSNFMSDLGTEFAYAPRTLFTLEAPTFEEKQRNRSTRKDNLGGVWGNRLNSMAEGATWYMGGELGGAAINKAAQASIPYLLNAEQALGKVVQPFKGTIQNYKSGIDWAKNNPNWRKDHMRFQKDLHPDIRVVRRDYEKDLRNKLIEEGKVTPTIKEKIKRKVASTVDDLRTKAILPLGKKEAALIGKAQQKALQEGVDVSNAWFYPTKPQGYRQNPVTKEWDIVESTETYLRPHIKNKIMGILEEGIVRPKGGSSFETGLKQAMFQNSNPYRLGSTGFNFNKSVSPAFKTKNLLLENSALPLWKEYQKGNLTKSQALGLIKDIGKWGGMNFSGSGGPSTTFRNTGNYLKNPKSVFKVAAHETGHSLQEIGIGNIHNALGHAMKYGDPKMSLSWGDLVATMPRGYKYYIPNTTTKIGRKAEKILVPPHMGEQGVWHASPNEVHSELMAHRADIINRLKKRGDISTEDAVKWLQEHEWEKNVKLPLTKNKKTGEWEYPKGRTYGTITPKDDYISKLRGRGFFKKGVSDGEILEFLKLFPAFTGAAVVGSAGIKD